MVPALAVDVALVEPVPVAIAVRPLPLELAVELNSMLTTESDIVMPLFVPDHI